MADDHPTAAGQGRTEQPGAGDPALHRPALQHRPGPGPPRRPHRHQPHRDAPPVRRPPAAPGRPRPAGHRRGVAAVPVEHRGHPAEAHPPARGAARRPGQPGVLPRLPAEDRTAQRPGRRRRSPAALGAPDPGLRLPGRLHPHGRGQRRDPAHRRMGDRARHPPARGMADRQTGLPRLPPGGQRLGAAADPPGLRPQPAQPPAAQPPAGRRAGGRGHRIGTDGERRAGPRTAASARPPQRPGGHRRLRHRPLLAGLPEDPAGLGAEDRPRLRQQHGHRTPGPPPGRDRDRHGAQLRLHHRRRRRGEARTGGNAQGHGLRTGPGLLVLAAAQGGAVHRVLRGTPVGNGLNAGRIGSAQAGTQAASPQSGSGLRPDLTCRPAHGRPAGNSQD
ncbi:hypothetical protein OF001_U50102 [Pseudomonas sp. OF001]|nr:hypothetical protein OF001_U50102 [Pseudomonas sp. OF001]